jgi:hypothetical protein
MKKNPIILFLLIIALLFALLSGCSADTPTQVSDSVSPAAEATQTNDTRHPDLLEGYALIEVEGDDLSGSREHNVVVNIGYGDRKYYAFTNEFGQLVKVIADEIILQDQNTEPVTPEGRYYPDEAKVPGTEAADLDEGHVIADSLGGVSNAYNITPQNSTLNRYGDQAYMEKVIRDAGGCTDFSAIITYPNTTTQTPSHYSYTYTLNGNVIKDEFDNVDPDEVNAALNVNTNESESSITSKSQSAITISMLDKSAEYVEITNNSSENIDMTGWYIVSVKGNQTYKFPDGYTLNSGAKIKVVSNSAIGDLQWTTKNVWNNSDDDDAELYDKNGILISRWDD